MYNPDIHKRKSIRLKGYDYSQEGLYFITICTQNKEHLFGEIEDGKMILNVYGDIVEKNWFNLMNHINNIRLHEFVVMPNHFHGIIEIANKKTVGAGSKPALRENKYSGRAGLEPAPTSKSQSLPEVVRQLKTFSARQINKVRDSVGNSVWQRNYYENIIRNEEKYLLISEYIINNPVKWEDDKYFSK